MRLDIFGAAVYSREGAFMHLRTMTIADYDRVCALWMSSPNMGFTVREDLNYRNFTFDEMIRVDT